MIDEPGCTAGSAISARPARGPMLSSRRSLAILPSSTASRRIAPEYAEHIAHALRDAEEIRRRLQRPGPCTRTSLRRRAAVVVAGVQSGADRRRAEVQLAQLLGRGRRHRRRRARCTPRSRRTPARASSARRPAGACGRSSAPSRTRRPSARSCRPGRAPLGRAVLRPSSSASRVAVGKTSLVDCPMLT